MKWTTKNISHQSPVPVAARSAAARLLGLWVRIPPGAWMLLCFECCVLSGRGLCDKLITRPEQSHRLWCVVCDLETFWMKRPWPTGGLMRQKQTKNKKPVLIDAFHTLLPTNGVAARIQMQNGRAITEPKQNASVKKLSVRLCVCLKADERVSDTPLCLAAS